jgi:hypothetical protein
MRIEAGAGQGRASRKTFLNSAQSPCIICRRIVFIAQIHAADGRCRQDMEAERPPWGGELKVACRRKSHERPRDSFPEEGGTLFLRKMR